MAPLRRQRGPRHDGMSPVLAGAIALVFFAAGVYLGFSGANPFADPFTFSAVFENTDNVKVRSPVRIAGVEVGKVTAIEPLGGGGGRVTMEIEDDGLPIHADAELTIRTRIFLEGNKFVDLRPGPPSAPELADGGTIPMEQTAASVSLGDVLRSLQRDTRRDLQVFLSEYSAGLEGDGARGFNEAIRYWESAYRNSSLGNDAALGRDRTADLQRVLRGQQRTFAALAEDERALRSLVVDLDATAAALARQDEALAASIPALRDTLRAARPALASLNAALPTVGAFARDALPGARSSGPTLEHSLPFVRELDALFGPRELGGAARVLRSELPSLVRLNEGTVAVLEQGRSLSACTSDVLVPFATAPIPHPEFPELHNEPFVEVGPRALTGLSGESRVGDASGQYFHAQFVAPPTAVTRHPSGNEIRPAPPPDGGRTPPPHRPDVPCETQEPPNLDSATGPVSAFTDQPTRVDRTLQPPNLEQLARLLTALEAAR